jgi:hypothetical protein
VHHQTPTPYQHLIGHQALSHAAIEDFDEAIVVAGSRDYNDYDQFKDLLEEYLIREFPRNTIIFITGKARKGPDDMIIRWCRENGRAWTEFAADWDDISVPGAFVKRNRMGVMYNARAGHMRNAKMAEAGTRVLAFWDCSSPGTKNMIDEAEKHGIVPKVILVNRDLNIDKRERGNNDGREAVWEAPSS